MYKYIGVNICDMPIDYWGKYMYNKIIKRNTKATGKAESTHKLITCTCEGKEKYQ